MRHVQFKERHTGPRPAVPKVVARRHDADLQENMSRAVWRDSFAFIAN